MKRNMKSMLTGAVLALIAVFSCNVIHSADDKGKGREVSQREDSNSFHVATALASARGALSDGDLEEKVRKEVSERRGSSASWDQDAPLPCGDAYIGPQRAEQRACEERYKETQKKTKIALKNNALQRLKQVGIEGVEIVERIFESTKATSSRASSVLDIMAFKDKRENIHVAVFRELFDEEGRVTKKSNYKEDFFTGLVAVIAEGTMAIRTTKNMPIRTQLSKTTGRPMPKCASQNFGTRDFYDDGLRAINGFMEGLHRNHGVIPSTIVGYRTGGQCVLDWLTDDNSVISMGGFLDNWNYIYPKKFKNTKIITIDNDIKYKKGSQQVIHQPISTNMIHENKRSEYYRPLEKYFTSLASTEKVVGTKKVERKETGGMGISANPIVIGACVVVGGAILLRYGWSCSDMPDGYLKTAWDYLVALEGRPRASGSHDGASDSDDDA